MSKERLDHLLSLFYRGQYLAFDQELDVLLHANPPPDIRAKLLSWSAQSFEKQHMPAEALLRYQEAKAICRDANAIAEFEEAIHRLQEQLQVQKPSEKIGSSPLEQGISFLRTQNTQRAETLLLSSVAQADLEEDPKSRVLSRLALARLPSYTHAMIEEAMTIAQQSNDMNLITAVKKTMDQLQIKIPPKVF